MNIKLASPHDRADAYIDRKVQRDHLSTGSHAFRGSQLALALVDGALLKGAVQPLANVVLSTAASISEAVGPRKRKH